MEAIVFASKGGRKYHFDKGCPAFHSAQDLSDLDCGCDTHCTHRLPHMHALRQMSATKAAIYGKLPCLACVPEHLREIPEGSGFGHVPEKFDSPRRGPVHVCVRCRKFDVYGYSRDERVLWPCTSAIVLGLAPQLERAA